MVELVTQALRRGEVLGLRADDYHPDPSTARLWGCYEPTPHLHVERRVDAQRDRLLQVADTEDRAGVAGPDRCVARL